MPIFFEINNSVSSNIFCDMDPVSLFIDWPLLMATKISYLTLFNLVVG